MKHVIEFNKINEEDEYIDIMNTDKKSQIMDILNQYKTNIVHQPTVDYSAPKLFGIKEEDFDEIVEEISKLF